MVVPKCTPRKKSPCKRRLQKGFPKIILSVKNTIGVKRSQGGSWSSRTTPLASRDMALPHDALVFVGLAAGMQFLLLWSAVLSLKARLEDIRRFGRYLHQSLRRLNGDKAKKPRKKSEYEETVAYEMHCSRARLAFGLNCMYGAICFGCLLLVQIQIEDVWDPLLCWAILGHAAYFIICIWVPCMLSSDSIYVLFLLSTLFYLSPLVTEPSHYVETSMTLVLVLRIPSVIIPSYIGSVVLCNAGFFLMSMTRIFLDDWSSAYLLETSPLNNPLRSRVVVMEVLSEMAILAFAILVKAFLKKSAEKTVEEGASSKLSQQLNAATSLLHLCCDAVVELDSRLRLRKHSSELAAMLLRDFQGASLAEMKLTDFMPAVDATKAMHYLQDFRSTSRSSQSSHPRQSKQAHAFISRLVDSGATKLKVEIFQVMYQTSGGETCHLVGIRDITDTKPIVSDEDDSNQSEAAVPVHAVEEQASECRSEFDMALRSQTRVCLDLDLGENMVVSSATAPMTTLVGASIPKLFPASICMLMRRISEEGRLFLDRNEPLPGKTFSFECLPAQWSKGEPEEISGFFQLAKNVSGEAHVLMFFHVLGRGQPWASPPDSPGSPCSPLSPKSLSPPASMSRRSSSRSNREASASPARELREVAERPRGARGSMSRGSPRTPRTPQSLGAERRTSVQL